MVKYAVPGAGGGGRKRKRAGRRAKGLHVEERKGFYYVIGTVRAGGHSIRMRRSLGIPSTAENYDEAWAEISRIEQDLRAQATGGNTRGDPVAVAVIAYLTRKMARPLGNSSVTIAKKMSAKFGARRLNEVSAADWRTWCDEQQAKNTAETRERFISTVAAVLNFARKFHGMSVVVEFDRDKAARNPRKRKKRHVSDVRPDLIARLMNASHISIRAQLATEWSTGARVSSVLFGVAVRDVVLAPGRGSILFRDTKNGEDVPAALHPRAVEILTEYAQWRGGLHNRDDPFFLTYKRKPYVDNLRVGGGQNKTGFNGAKRRAIRGLLKDALAASRKARKQGRRERARDIFLQARSDARLLREITQHWFRHLLATRMRGDIRAAMAQGGWLDERSVMGYIRDIADDRRAIVSNFEDFGRSLTQDDDDDALTG